jgi:hypothetical protein
VTSRPETASDATLWFENHIDAALAGDPLHFGGNVLFVVVDDLIRAELARAGQLLLAAGGRDDATVKQLRDLYRRLAHAARRREHQHLFARLQRRSADQHVPGGEEHKRSGGGVFEAEVSDDRDYGVFGNIDQLAIGGTDGN